MEPEDDSQAPQAGPPPDVHHRDVWARQQDLDITPQRFARVANDLGRWNSWQQVVGIFGQMRERDVASYSALLAVLGKAGLWEKAASLLDEMRALWLEPTVVTYNGALGAAVSTGWPCASRFLGDMLQRRVRPNGITYQTLMRVCAAGQEWERALAMLSKMPRSGIEPSLKAYKAMLGTLVAEGVWELALAVLDDMAQRGVQPDTDALHTTVDVCASACRWREALGLLERAKVAGASLRRRQRPPEAFYASAMRACEKCRKWEQALHLYGELSQVNKSPTSETALGSCALGGCWRQALWVLGRMHRIGLEPELKCYNDAIAACEPRGKWVEALSLLSRLERQSLRPDVASYSACMGACDAGGRWAWSLSLLDRGRSRGLQPDKVSFSIAACSSARGGNWRTAIDLLGQAADEGVLHDHALDAEIRSCMHRGGQDAVRRLTDVACQLRLKYSRPGACL